MAQVDPAALSPLSYWPFLLLLALLSLALSSQLRQRPATVLLAALTLYGTNPAARSAKRPAVPSLDIEYFDTPLFSFGYAWPPRCMRTVLGVQCQPDAVVVGVLGRWHSLDVAQLARSLEHQLVALERYTVTLRRFASQYVMAPVREIVTPPGTRAAASGGRAQAKAKAKAQRSEL